MSTGGLIGGIVGGIVGLAFGLQGAYYGWLIGFGIGTLVDPMMPDMPTPGRPDMGKNVMQSTIGNPIPSLIGTGKITGHLLCYGGERVEEVKSGGGGGKGGGGGGEATVTKYKYYMSWAVGIAEGPVDTLYTIFRNDEAVWTGELNRPVDGSSETIVIEGMGTVVFFFGTSEQESYNRVAKIVADENLAYKGMCWAFFDDCYIGEYYRTPSMRFVLKKIPTYSFSAKNEIQTLDANPAHCLWFVLHELAGLPETWLHENDFAAIADTLYDEERGLSILFDRQQDAMMYTESINSHADCILRYGSDSKFHPKVIREDYDVNDLLLVDEDVLLEDPAINRRGWIDTINEVKAQYTEIIRPSISALGECKAAMSQPDTPYIYLYDINAKAVVKIDTSEIPPFIAEVLFLESLYDLDVDMGVGFPGSQRGGYCMNKDGSKIWYMFRNSERDCQLIEVDISQATMAVVKKTTFLDLMLDQSAYWEKIEDGCSDDTYTYWPTTIKTGRVIKIRNSDHVITDDHLFSFDPCPGYSWVPFEGVKNIDYHDGNLYWSYVYDLYYVSQWYRRYTLARSDIDFNEITSTNDPYSNAYNEMQAIIRVHSGYLFHQQRDNGTILRKRNLDDCLMVAQEQQGLVQNIFGVVGSNLLFLTHEYSGTPHGYIFSVSFNTLNGAGSSVDVSWETGLIWPGGGVPWEMTATSAMSQQTGVIAIFRFNFDEQKGYVACFKKTGESFEKLCDTSDLKKEVIVDLKDNVSNSYAIDIGNQKVQGKVVSKTLKFASFTTNKNAVWAAKQQLQKESYPFAFMDLVVNRDIFRLQVGDCFKFSYDKYGISNAIYRVLLISEENLTSEEIHIKAMEDIFGVSNAITKYVPPIPYTPDPPDYDLSPFVYQTVKETPFVEAGNFIEIIPIACKVKATDLGMVVYMSLDGGSSYSKLENNSNLRYFGTLSGSYSKGTYTIDEETGFSVIFIGDPKASETTTWPNLFSGEKNVGLLGDEFVSFKTITPMSGLIYKLENVIRGRFGTQKIDHVEGEDFWIADSDLSSISNSEFIYGASRKFKLVPYNIRKLGDISEAIPIDHTFTGVAKTPYTPINFMANGSSYAARYQTAVTLTWSHRYRGKGAGIGLPGEVLADSDIEGLFEIEIWVSGIEVRTASGIMGSAWVYSQAMNLVDNGVLPDVIEFKLSNYIVDGGDTYKSDQVDVTCKKGDGAFYQDPFVGGRWEQKAYSWASEREEAFVAGAGNKFYAGFGRDQSSPYFERCYRADWWEYDPATDTWTRKPIPSDQHAPCYFYKRRAGASVECGGKVYIGFGNDAVLHRWDWWEYDPATDTWVEFYSDPTEQVTPSRRVWPLSGSAGGKIYLGLGVWTGAEKDWWEFDPAAGPATNCWTRKADFVNQRSQGVATGLGGKVYVGLGASVDLGNAPTKDWWEYDPATDTWTQKADFGGTYKLRGVCVGHNGKIYVGLGSNWATPDYGGYTPGKDWWEYNIAADAWTQKADFGPWDLDARDSASIAIVNGTIYAGLGRHRRTARCKREWREYNIAADTWTIICPFGGNSPPPRWKHTGAAAGGKLYMGTGLTDFDQVKDWWEFDPQIGADGEWTEKGLFTGAARSQAVAAEVGGKIYMGLGDVTGVGVGKDWWEYTPATDTWVQKLDFGGSARYGAVAVESGNKIYAGLGFSTTYEKDWWEYNPVANIWTQKADFALGTSGRFGAVVAEANGFIFAGLGTGAEGLLVDWWMYDCANDDWRQVDSFPGRPGADVAIASGTNVYVGLGVFVFLAEWWMYDTTTYSWSRSVDFTEEVRKGLAVAINSTDIYVCGGRGFSRCNDELWRFYEE